MQRNNPILLATIALGLLALLGVAFMFFGSKGTPQPTVAVATPTPAPLKRYVARGPIPPRTLLTQEQLPALFLEIADSTAPPADAVTDLKSLDGMITNEPIVKGEPITTSLFTPTLARVVPANFVVPTSKRAVAIYVDPDQTAAGLVDVGDHVDIVAAMKRHQEKDNNTLVIGAIDFTAGRMVASNLEVLAVDKSINAPHPTPTPRPGAAAAPGQAVAGGPPPEPTPPPPAPAPGQVSRIRVVLAADPETATRLIAAADQGPLHVIIRNPADADSQPVSEVREYPSTTVYVKPKTPATGGNARSTNPMPSPDFGNKIPIVRDNQGPGPVMVATPGPFPTPAPVPYQQATKEVTIVRGTEKTLATVPQR